MKTVSLYLPLFFILIFLIYVLADAVSEYPSSGILVEIDGLKDSCRTETRLYHGPLTVRVSSGKRLELGKEQVGPGELLFRLEQIYSLRAEHTLFIDADPDVDAGQVIAVLDLISQSAQDIHVKLITPRNRKDTCTGILILPAK